MARILDIKTLDPTNAAFNSAVDECAQVLLAGGIACIPTDSVYGFAAATTLAAEKICILKGRPLAQKFPLLISTADDLDTYAQNVTVAARSLSKAYWPGALTLVVEASDALPYEVMEEDGSVALRVPNSTFVQTLIKKTGPLATTSANLHTKDAAACLEDLDEVLLETVDIAIDGGKTKEQQASTIVDVREEIAQTLHDGEIQEGPDVARKEKLAGARILRIGSIAEQDIWGSLHVRAK